MFGRRQHSCDHAKTIDEQRDELRRLRIRVDELENEVEVLAGRHTQLRGVVYGKGIHKENAQPRVKTKAEILAERFTPGQPAKHD